MDTFAVLLPIMHVGFSMLSIATYLARALLRLTKPEAANLVWLSDVSVISALFMFISGIMLAFVLRIPFTTTYVIFALLGLLVYTAMSVIAFKPFVGKGTAVLSWLLGLGAFSYVWSISNY